MSRVSVGTGYQLPRIGLDTSKSGTDWVLVSSITMSLGLVVYLLAAIILPNTINRAAQARVGAAQTDLRVLAAGVRNFRLDNDRYPTNDEGLQALVIPPPTCQNWRGPYVSGSIPADPWHNDYRYESPDSNVDGAFTVSSLGADGRPGGTGTDADLTLREE